jgi:hypothetical protein
MIRKLFIITGICLFLLSGLSYAADVTLEEVDDHRTTGEFFSNLTIKISAADSSLDKAVSMRFIPKVAVDDLGNNLIEQEETPDFKEITSWNYKDNKAQIEVKLKNPAREAKTVKELKGVLEVYNPSNDPGAVAVIENFKSLTGKKINSQILEKQKVEIALITEEQAKEGTNPLESAMGEALSEMMGGFFGMGDAVDTVMFTKKDPDKKVIELKVFDKKGNEIERGGWMSSDDTYFTYNYNTKVPADAQMKIYLKTDKALNQIPIELSNVQLP